MKCALWPGKSRSALFQHGGKTKTCAHAARAVVAKKLRGLAQLGSSAGTWLCVRASAS